MYHSVYEQLIHPIVLRASGAPNSIEKLNELRATQFLTQTELKQLQLRRLNIIVHHALLHSAFYREKYQGIHSLDQVFSDLKEVERLPILEKEEVRQHLDAIAPSIYAHERYEYRTGGTTGDFLKIYVPKTIMKSYSWAAAARAWQWVGFNPGDKFVRIWGLAPDVSRKQTIKSKFFNFIQRRYDLNAFRLSEAECNEHIRKLQLIKPKILYSHATPLSRLARVILDKGIRISGIRSIVMTAEMLLPQERSIIEDAFQANVYDFYGNRETNIIAAQCRNKTGYHLSSENGLVEVVDTNGKHVNEGEIGEILITDFHNYVMPLIRYRIGDLARCTYHTCSCGIKLPMLKQIIGRKLETIQTRSGEIVPGEFFILLFETLPFVEKAQIIQENLDSLTVNIALKDPETGIESHKDRITNSIRKHIGDFHIDLNVKPFNEFLVSGKHRWVISKIAADCSHQ